MHRFGSLYAMKRSQIMALCVLGTLLIHGCGGGTVRPKGEQASVTGSIVFEQKPITVGSTVVFYCKDKDATAAGTLDAQGKFSLSGAIPSVGIPVGKYVVMVNPPQPPIKTSLAAGPSSPDYQKQMMQNSNAAKPVSTASDIPDQFLSLDKSTLSYDLVAGPNTFDIDLAKVGK
jgi:hypothetical protein